MSSSLKGLFKPRYPLRRSHTHTPVKHDWRDDQVKSLFGDAEFQSTSGAPGTIMIQALHHRVSSVSGRGSLSQHGLNYIGEVHGRSLEIKRRRYSGTTDRDHHARADELPAGHRYHHLPLPTLPHRSTPIAGGIMRLQAFAHFVFLLPFLLLLLLPLPLARPRRAR